MSFRKVTAIVNRMCLETVETAVRRTGVRGISVSVVKGFGEYANYFKHDWLTTHLKIEVYVTTDRATQIAQAIMDAAHTGCEGDGLVAIVPVEQLFRIRNRAPATAADL